MFWIFTSNLRVGGGAEGAGGGQKGGGRMGGLASTSFDWLLGFYSETCFLHHNMLPSLQITFSISMYVMCVCLFSALSRRVGALQISTIIIINIPLIHQPFLHHSSCQTYCPAVLNRHWNCSWKVKRKYSCTCRCLRIYLAQTPAFYT